MGGGVMKTEILIAERELASEALAASEERYKRLLAATTDYIYTVNIEHGLSRSTYHGPGCEGVTGYSPADFANDPYLWYRIIHEKDRPAVLAQIDRILHGETPPPLEHRIICRDGGLRWIRNTTIPHRNGHSRLVAYDGLISDITERKRSEEILQNERNLLRTLVDNLPDFIFATNGSGCFVMNNLAHARALGASDVRDLLGKTEADFAPRAQAVQHRAAEESVFRSGQAQYNIEEPFIDAAGNQHWLSVTRVPLKDAQGNVVGLVGIDHDITTRKRADQALRESQERLSLVIRGSNDGIWDWNVLTGETYFSPRWKSMVGYEDDEIENNFSAWEQLIHPDDRDSARERVRAYFAGEIPVYELEHRLRHKDGSYRWILARGVALRDGNGKPVRMAGSHVDVTELRNAAERLKRANLELQETQSQLIQAARFESMGTLAAGVAHEVKNPLQTILMGLHYLTHKLAVPGEDVALALSDMRESVTRANAVIGDLLALSKATEFQTSNERLNEIIQHSLRLLHAQLDAARVTTALNLTPDLAPVKMDKRRMEQVFLNLFLNAAQAMPTGGVLTVTARAVVRDQDAAQVPPLFRKFQPGQKLLVVEVKDTGTGIKEEDLPRVFDPFFTSKPVGVGTGLGLSMAKMIIDRHGGAIAIENAPGGGVLASVVLVAA
jgi:PAS domain S-box-containing protein